MQLSGRKTEGAVVEEGLRQLPFYDEHRIPLCRVLTGRGSEYCGDPEQTFSDSLPMAGRS